jgi:hypothetical protein
MFDLCGLTLLFFTSFYSFCIIDGASIMAKDKDDASVQLQSKN